MNDIDERVVSMVLNSSKLTGRMVVQSMKSFIHEYRMFHKEVKQERKHQKQQKKQAPKTGKQTLKELMFQGKQTTFVSLDERPDLKAIQKELNHYSVDFSIVKEGKNTWRIFFKAQDTEVFNAAFKKVIETFDQKNAGELEKELPKHNEEKTLSTEQTKSDKVVPFVSKEAKQANTIKDKPQSKNHKVVPMTMDNRIEKARKEATAYNRSVSKEKNKKKAKDFSNKRGPEK